MPSLIICTQRTRGSLLWKKYETDPIGYEPYNSELQRPEHTETIKTIWYKKRLLYPIGYIDYLLGKVKCVKICMEFVPIDALKKILECPIEKILLERKDRRAQYLSLRRAEATGQWWVEGEKIPYQDKFDQKDFEQYKGKIDNLYNFARKHIKFFSELEYKEVHN